jgi:hypothetical protein
VTKLGGIYIGGVGGVLGACGGNTCSGSKKVNGFESPCITATSTLLWFDP